MHGSPVNRAMVHYFIRDLPDLVIYTPIFPMYDGCIHHMMRSANADCMEQRKRPQSVRNFTVLLFQVLLFSGFLYEDIPTTAFASPFDIKTVGRTDRSRLFPFANRADDLLGISPPRTVLFKGQTDIVYLLSLISADYLQIGLIESLPITGFASPRNHSITQRRKKR